MRMTILVAMAAVASVPVLAQTTPSATTPPSATNQRPVDNGPFTAQASQAYQGGGVVLQGAPGAPAPQPQATPPGQTPRNAVP